MTNWTKEQQLAIDKENTNIIVSAGAGSGKTAVLTERVIRKLKSSVNINELLILTFTNKAAYEMKDRIRAAISEDTSLHCQLDYIDSSYITTFDSFALSIVKKYNYILNIDKNVQIADSSIIYLEKKKIIDEIFDNLYSEENADFLKLLDDFTVKDSRDIKKYILDINNKLDLKYDKAEYLNAYLTDYFSKSNFNKLIKEYENLIKINLNEIEKLLDEFSSFVETDYFLEVNETLSNLLGQDKYDDIKRCVEIKLPNLPRGSSDEAKEIKEKIINTLEKVKKYTRFSSTNDIENIFKSTKIYSSIIIKIIELLDSKISEYKAFNNVYEFNDISKMAIRILKENEYIKDELKSSFKEIMIDEYQDTSDLQEEFISMIDNNNVYMVGDIKQSIYRFRNANPYLFKNKYDMYSSNLNGFKIDLTNNFRSREEVINNINQIFSCLMTDDLGGADYKEAHQMIFGNRKYENEGKVNQNSNIEVFNYEYDKDLGYSKEEIEIFFIAQDISRKLKEEYKVFDKKTSTIRLATYSDFAILLDKSANFDLYKKIFEYFNLPLSKYSSTNITSELEISTIKNILKLIITSKNKDFGVEFKYAFTSIARSYLFSYTDEEIFEMFFTNNFFDNKVMIKINEIVKNIDSMSLGELIMTIIGKFSFYEKQIEIGDVKNRINRLSAIIDIFDNLASIGYDIYDAYDYLEQVIEEEYKLEIKEQDSNSNSIKIMTIHASKGLEFPVCYFASLHSEFNIRELNEKFLYNNKYGIITPYFKDGIGKTFVKDLVKNDYINEEISEKIRLLYVALTRAKEKVIMITSFGDKKSDITLESSRSFLDMLTIVKDSINDYIYNIDVKKLQLTKEYSLIKKYNYIDNIEKCDNKLAIKKIEVENERLTKNKISKEISLLDKDIKKKVNFGTEIHEIMEELDFNNPKLSKTGISDFYKDRIRDFIKSINIDKVENLYREYEFIYQDSKEIKHGIIDLILEYSDVIKIVDYKLKNIEDDNYKRQLSDYAKYIATKTNKKIETYLFSIVDGQFLRIK